MKEGTTLGHCVSAKDLEVEKAKIEVIEKFPLPTYREIKASLGISISIGTLLAGFLKLLNQSAIF